jgi:hypothetical protein
MLCCRTSANGQGTPRRRDPRGNFDGLSKPARTWGSRAASSRLAWPPARAAASWASQARLQHWGPSGSASAAWGMARRTW